MKDLKEKIEVMQAALDGEEIQIQLNPKWGWISAYQPNFEWGEYDYRIKPKPLEYWLDVWEATRGTKEIYLSMSGDKPEFAKEYDDIRKVNTIKVREVTDE